MENNNLFSKEELRAKVFALQTMNQTINVNAPVGQFVAHSDTIENK